MRFVCGFSRSCRKGFFAYSNYLFLNIILDERFRRTGNLGRSQNHAIPLGRCGCHAAGVHCRPHVDIHRGYWCDVGNQGHPVRYRRRIPVGSIFDVDLASIENLLCGVVFFAIESLGALTAFRLLCYTVMEHRYFLDRDCRMKFIRADPNLRPNPSGKRPAKEGVPNTGFDCKKQCNEVRSPNILIIDKNAILFCIRKRGVIRLKSSVYEKPAFLHVRTIKPINNYNGY